MAKRARTVQEQLDKVEYQWVKNSDTRVRCQRPSCQFNQKATYHSFVKVLDGVRYTGQFCIECHQPSPFTSDRLKSLNGGDGVGIDEVKTEFRPPFEVWYSCGHFHISWDDGDGGRNYPDPDHQGEDGYDHREDGKKAAEYIKAALNGFEIYKDDFLSANERLQKCLNNSRCPECGCGDVSDAEAGECGCDAPVCAIECPETLAEAYVRVFKERDALREELEELKRERCGT